MQIALRANYVRMRVGRFGRTILCCGVQFPSLDSNETLDHVRFSAAARCAPQCALERRSAPLGHTRYSARQRARSAPRNRARSARRSAAPACRNAHRVAAARTRSQQRATGSHERRTHRAATCALPHTTRTGSHEHSTQRAATCHDSASAIPAIQANENTIVWVWGRSSVLRCNERARAPRCHQNC